MAREVSYGLMQKVLVLIVVGGLFYLIAKYLFFDPNAEGYTIWLIASSAGYLILQYLFQKFHGMVPRVLISILAGGLFYLIAHDVFSYRHAKYFGILIAAVLGGFAILQYLSQRLRGITPKILIPILGGALFYLIAQYVFSYSDAARVGIVITAASGGFFIFKYLLE
jgi:hypothetical protein